MKRLGSILVGAFIGFNLAVSLIAAGGWLGIFFLLGSALGLCLLPLVAVANAYTFPGGAVTFGVIAGAFIYARFANQIKRQTTVRLFVISLLGLPFGVGRVVESALEAIAFGTVVWSDIETVSLPPGLNGEIIYRNSTADFIVLDMVTGNQRNISIDGPLDGYHFQRRPNSTQILFAGSVSGTRHGFGGLFLLEEPSNSIRRVSSAGESIVSRFVWSPDGRYVLYRLLVPNILGSYIAHLHILDFEANTRTVIRFANSIGILGFDWSPDTHRIVIAASLLDDLESSIYILDTTCLASCAPVQITNADALYLHPTWSPDGQSIAFSSDVEGFRAIYTMNVDGNDRRQLTGTFGTEAEDNTPLWSPDGAYIAFERRVDEEGSLYLMRSDGSEVTRITSVYYLGGLEGWWR